MYVLVHCFPWFKFGLPLFLFMVISDNELETRIKLNNDI